MATELVAAESTGATPEGRVRVVTFGRSSAGKATLLSALGTAEQNQRAVLIDYDGRTADELIASSTPDKTDGAFFREIRSADAIIFVIDASQPAEQLDADLSAAQQFLRRFRQERGENLA